MPVQLSMERNQTLCTASSCTDPPDTSTPSSHGNALVTCESLKSESRDTEIKRFCDVCGSGKARQSLSHQLVPPLKVKLLNQQ